MTTADWQVATGALIRAVVIIGLVWDLVAFYCGGNEATISWQIRGMAHRHPILAFLLGLCAGHWLWNQGI